MGQNRHLIADSRRSVNFRRPRKDPGLAALETRLGWPAVMAEGCRWIIGEPRNGTLEMVQCTLRCRSRYRRYGVVRRPLAIGLYDRRCRDRSRSVDTPVDPDRRAATYGRHATNSSRKPDGRRRVMDL